MLPLTDYNSLDLTSDWLSFSEASFNEFGLFCDPMQNGFLSDSPSSSFPSSPLSCFSSSDALSPDQQEINDIVSSFQTQSYSPVSSLPIPSPIPSPLLPRKRSHDDIIEECVTPPPTPPTPPAKRSPKLSTTDRKQRKKKQNKTAALRYRQKKKGDLDLLTKEQEVLEISNKKLKDQVDSLSAEIACLKKLWSNVYKTKSQCYS